MEQIHSPAHQGRVELPGHAPYKAAECDAFIKDNMGWSGWEEFGNLTTDDKIELRESRCTHYQEPRMTGRRADDLVDVAGLPSAEPSKCEDAGRGGVGAFGDSLQCWLGLGPDGREGVKGENSASLSWAARYFLEFGDCRSGGWPESLQGELGCIASESAVLGAGPARRIVRTERFGEVFGQPECSTVLERCVFALSYETHEIRNSVGAHVGDCFGVRIQGWPIGAVSPVNFEFEPFGQGMSGIGRLAVDLAVCVDDHGDYCNKRRSGEGPFFPGRHALMMEVCHA